MKGLLVFSEINDAVFLSLDDELNAHVKEGALKQRYIEVVSDDLDPNVVMQLFAPLVTSQRFMTEQVKNPYSVVTMENGFIFALKQYDGQIHLAINGDGTEREDLLIRKLFLFQRIMNFKLGPVSKQIRPDSMKERIKTWSVLSKMLATWSRLRSEEQCFLVEAVERLQVNSDLNKTCVDALESSIMRLRSAGDKKTVHALLLTGCKQLALYSSRGAPELEKSDILMISLLVNTILPSGGNLTDLLSTVHLSKVKEALDEKAEKYESAQESAFECSGSDKEQYFSSRSTPVSEPTTAAENDQDESMQSSLDTSASVDYDAKPQLSPVAEEHISTSVDVSSSSLLTPSIARTQQSKEQHVQNPTTDASDIKSHVVFLRTPLCPCMPHLLVCIQVLPGVTLVLARELSKAGYSVIIHQTLSLIQSVLSKGLSASETSHGRYTQELIETSLKKLMEFGKKKKVPTATLR